MSSRDQSDDLEHGVEYTKSKGASKAIRDMDSRPNEKRRGYTKLGKVLSNEVGKVTVTHADRLTRFGFETLEQVFQAHGAEIDVLNEANLKTPQQELVEALIAIISCFSGKP